MTFRLTTSLRCTEYSAICLDTLQDEQEIRGLICKHVFHGACFDQWLQKGHLDCPLCRSSSSANAT
ncbi:MAG: hypothetical protein FE78DRAFT_148673 [Acidomyces sp. 'richmondensis']|nr:MAG: hypothetical protein FE78DRAFT_148673 [Acidomyces sp. 'richmondensis']